MIVDPTYNRQYTEIHQNSQYGISGLTLLPEIALYIFEAMQLGRITQTPCKILDYGCGQSSLLEALDYVFEPMAATTQLQLSVMPAAVQERIEQIVKSNNSPVPSAHNHLLQLHRYEPAIEKYSQLPQGPFDFVICSDVMEHIPDDHREGQPSVLDSVIQTIGMLSSNIYLNISTRLAGQILPNGQNAHCTVMPTHKWHTKLSSILTVPVIEVSSRDNTACSFITFEPSQACKQAMQEIEAQYGRLDPAWYQPKSDSA